MRDETSYLMADDDERADHFRSLHPLCERCDVEVCRAATADPRDVDCICHQSVPGGVIVDGLVYCGSVCAEAHKTPVPVPVVDAETAPVDVAASVPAVRYERAMVGAFWKMGGVR